MRTTFTHPDLAGADAEGVLSASGCEVGPPVPVTIVMLDTFDGRLDAAGLRLLHRSGPEAELVLAQRSGAPPAHLTGVVSAPRWPADLPPGPFRDRVMAHSQERALLPVLSVSSVVRSARRVDRRGKATVRCEAHESLLVDGEELSGWAIELSPAAGHHDDLEVVADHICALGWQQDDGDLMAVVAARAGRAIVGHSSSPTVDLDRRESAFVAFRRVLANLSATIDANLKGTVDDIDVEFLHDLRVAVRRTRSVLAQAKGVLPAQVRDRYREDFGWLGQATGPTRDLDVYLLGWDGYVAPLDLPDHRGLDRVRAELEDRRRVAQAELAAVLTGDACRKLLESWRRWLTDPDATPTDDEQPIGPLIAKRITKAQQRVLTDGRAITPASPGARLHDLRKDAKKLRYLLECFGSLFPAKARKAFVAQLKALQDNLGAHQDAEVHLAQLRQLAHDLHEQDEVDTDALLAMGRLSDHLERRRQRERNDFVDRFAAYDTKANRQALAELLRKAERA